MNELDNLLTVWIYGIDCNGKKKRRPKNLTYFMIREMEFVCTRLKSEKIAYFVESDLVPYLEKCGINVEKKANDIVYTAWIE